MSNSTDGGWTMEGTAQAVGESPLDTSRIDK